MKIYTNFILKILLFLILSTFSACESPPQDGESQKKATVFLFQGEEKVSVESEKDKEIERQKKFVEELTRRFEDFQRQVKYDQARVGSIERRYDSLLSLYTESLNEVQGKSKISYEQEKIITDLKLNLANTEKAKMEAERRLRYTQDSLRLASESLARQYEQLKSTNESIKLELDKYKKYIENQDFIFIQCTYQHEGKQILLKGEAAHKVSHIKEIEIDILVNLFKLEEKLKKPLSSNFQIEVLLYESGKAVESKRIRLEDGKRSFTWQPLQAGNYHLELRYENTTFYTGNSFKIVN
jgi:uncharacterized coiled-coil protein SlyX